MPCACACTHARAHTHTHTHSRSLSPSLSVIDKHLGGPHPQLLGLPPLGRQLCPHLLHLPDQLIHRRAMRGATRVQGARRIRGRRTPAGDGLRGAAE